MVRSCSAYGCSNRWQKESNIIFYRIPSNKNLKLRSDWLQNIKRDGVLPKDENFLICSAHFEDGCFIRDLKVICVFEIYINCSNG